MEFSLCAKITENISQVIVGKHQAIELLLVGLLAEGHVLLEDVPGVAKTLLAKSLAKSIGGTFNRVQFTPDLLPADITGFNVYDQKENFERTLEVVASLAVRLDSMGYAVGFAANGTLKGGYSSEIPLSRGPQQIPAILEILARIQATPTGAVTKVIKQFLGSQRGVSCVHFCYEVDSSVTDIEKILKKRHIPCSFVACRPDSNTQPSEGMNQFSIDEIRFDRSRYT